MPPAVRLLEVDDSNWRAVAAIAPREDQTRFVSSVPYYLCLCHFEKDWHPLAIEADGHVAGHVMWAIDESDGSTWLGGLVVDRGSQGRGIGRAAVTAFIDRFSASGHANIALSYLPDNVAARSLYTSMGFVETGEMEDDEVVARYRF